MEVYIEYALAENFCMDFFLLYAAKAVTKNRAGAWRISMSAALGACFAVVFPLFSLSGWAAIAVKLVAGALMCLAADKFSGVRSYLKFAGVFAALTFVLGGALIALFSLADISFEQGGGVIISSVPVGIPLFGVLCVAVAAKKITQKFVHSRSKTAVECRIYAGQSRISLLAFFDSGNKVYRRGAPVSVLPESYAKKLADLSRIKTYVTVHTVAGDKNLPVFTADKVEIDYGERVITLRGVLFCASRELSRRAVLHPDLAEAE